MCMADLVVSGSFVPLEHIDNSCVCQPLLLCSIWLPIVCCGVVIHPGWWDEWSIYKTPKPLLFTSTLSCPCLCSHPSGAVDVLWGFSHDSTQPRVSMWFYTCISMWPLHWPGLGRGSLVFSLAYTQGMLTLHYISLGNGKKLHVAEVCCYGD